MSCCEFEKNRSEKIHITPQRYQGYDLIDIRIYAKTRDGNWVLTKKGISLNIDQIPELIKGLEWALQQPCGEDGDGAPKPVMTKEMEEELASFTYRVLKKHGIAVHWDTAERMVLEDPKMSKFNKWQLHYILETRRDLFRLEGFGCFKAI